MIARGRQVVSLALVGVIVIVSGAEAARRGVPRPKIGSFARWRSIEPRRWLPVLWPLAAVATRPAQDPITLCIAKLANTDVEAVAAVPRSAVGGPGCVIATRGMGTERGGPLHPARLHITARNLLSPCGAFLVSTKHPKECRSVEKLDPQDFNAPAILLGGPVDYDMYKAFRSQLDSCNKEGLVVTELSTLGGDPEVARMMGEDIRFHSENSKNGRFVFLGKAAIYSAGTTFMSFFSIQNRYLTRGTRLMIHERKLDKHLHINGPLTTCVATVTATLHEIEASIAIQNEGFENLIRGSKVTMDEVLRRAPGNWYIEASEAKSLGLVAEVL